MEVRTPEQSAGGRAPAEIMLLIADQLRLMLDRGSGTLNEIETDKLLRRTGRSHSCVCKAWIPLGYALLYNESKVLLDAHVSSDKLDAPSLRAYKLADSLANGQTGQASYVRTLHLTSDYKWHEKGDTERDELHKWSEERRAKHAQLWANSPKGVESLRKLAASVTSLHVESDGAGVLLLLERALEDGVTFLELNHLSLKLETTRAGFTDGMSFDLGGFLHHFRCATLTLTLHPPISSWPIYESGPLFGAMTTEPIWLFQLNRSSLSGLPSPAELNLVEPSLVVVSALMPSMAPTLTSLKLSFEEGDRSVGVGPLFDEIAKSLGAANNLKHLSVDTPFEFYQEPGPYLEPKESNAVLASLISTTHKLESFELRSHYEPELALLRALPETLRTFTYEATWPHIIEEDERSIYSLWQTVCEWLGKDGSAPSLSCLEIWGESPMSEEWREEQHQLLIEDFVKLCGKRQINSRSAEMYAEWIRDDEEMREEAAMHDDPLYHLEMLNACGGSDCECGCCL